MTGIVYSFKGSKIYSGVLRHRSKDKSDSLFVDPMDAKLIDNKDSIAEPLYNLFEEIFELKDARWFRKTIMAFVQFTYGGTINRKIRQTIYWLLNEEMIVFYLEQIKNTFWQFNDKNSIYELIKIINNFEDQSEESKAEQRNIAKLKLLQNIPGMIILANFLSNLGISIFLS